MQLYEMQVSKTAIYRTAPVRIPKGIIGAAVKLSFSPEWEGLKKTVIFRAGDVVKDVLDIEDVAVIPAECTREAGVLLEIGVYGVDAESTVAIPTLWAAIGRVTEAADPSGDTTTDPQLPVWAQLQAQIHQLERQGVTPNDIEQAVLDYFAENEITPETIGAAPAGFGLGENSSGMVIYSSPEALDDLKTAGWYSYYNTDVFACEYVGTNYGGILVVPAMYGYTQFFFCRMHYEAYLKRHYDNVSGVWSAWEWVNPPMVVGREYRTTERYNGKPVYTMLVDCGNAPNNGNKVIEYAADINAVSPIYCRGQITTGGTEYYGEYLNDSYSYGALKGTIFSVNAYAHRVVITTNSDQTKAAVLAHVKYVKK